MDWHASITDQVPLIASRVGFLTGELRMYFRPVASKAPHYVLQLEEVVSFYDSLTRGVLIHISDRPEHGSFGWPLPPDDSHHSVKVTALDSRGFFLALARRVVYRVSGENEANNWPG